MKLYSTNNHKNVVSLKNAVLSAFPDDRGLYMPLNISKLDDSFFRNINQYSFQEIAYRISKNLFLETIPDEDLKRIIDSSINFKAPVVSIDKNISTLELFHGPTMAFKDFGARFMAELMSYFLQNETNSTTILVATSGDTGGAVASGFHNVPGIEVVILYPKGKVSPLQEQQLTTWGDNIRAIEVSGTFDDCQRLVKEAFVDNDLNEKFRFSSANSINIARLIPQSFYYFEAFKQLHDSTESLVFVVPSGNFGNITAGLLAKKMGLPVKCFVAAINANTTFTDYLSSGDYCPRPSISTLSNAMDVGDPSNFPRLKALCGSTWNNIKREVASYSFTDEQTSMAIRVLYNNYNYIADPHGAIGYLGSQESLKAFPLSHHVFLETAHPAKFSEIVQPIIDRPILLPHQLKRFTEGRKSVLSCSNIEADFKNLLMNF